MSSICLASFSPSPAIIISVVQERILFENSLLQRTFGHATIVYYTLISSPAASRFPRLQLPFSLDWVPKSSFRLQLFPHEHTSFFFLLLSPSLFFFVFGFGFRHAPNRLLVEGEANRQAGTGAKHSCIYQGWIGLNRKGRFKTALTQRGMDRVGQDKETHQMQSQIKITRCLPTPTHK
jgi:hypothetical protein